MPSLTAPQKFRTAFDQLHEIVATQVGSTDFGDEDYRGGLQMLLESMDYDPLFTEQGRNIAWGQLIDALSSRLIAFRSMAQNPNYQWEKLDRPVVITGLPRTGSTALHKLMAVDPQFQGLEKWLLSAPMPRPPRSSWQHHPYLLKEIEALNARYGATPRQRAAHNMVAEEVDECLWLQRQSFVSNFWTCGWSAATYDAWWQSQCELPSYRYLRQSLQLIGMNGPKRRWLLKNPSHILHLDLLFAVLPDALVIQTHRDPAKAVPSLCALLIQAHPIMELGRTEQRAHIMAVRETAKWAAGVRDAEAVRRARKEQVMDVLHAEFHANPLHVVRRIYGFIGCEFSATVEAAMRDRVANDPERAHGRHSYDVVDFGLTEEEIRERFGDYVSRFDLAPKQSLAS